LFSRCSCRPAARCSCIESRSATPSTSGPRAQTPHRFVDEQISPRFPGGFTVSDARGQWRTRDGVIQHERTHAVLIVHREGSAEGEIAAIITAYRKAFAQEAVLRTREHCGVAFQ